MHARRTYCTGTPQQGRPAWWHSTWPGALAVAMLLPIVASHGAQAKTFHCPAADVPCLIAAITEANTNGNKTNDIRLEAGVYALTTINNNTDGANGLPSVTGTLTITGEGAGETIIERAASSPGFRLLHVAPTGALTLEQVTLQGGLCYPCGNENLVIAGGGLFNRGRVTINDSILTANQAGGQGGGLWNTGTLTLTQSTLAANRGLFGGGLWNSGMTTITNSILIDNFAYMGGGIRNEGMLTITHSTLADNDGDYAAGGIQNFGTLMIMHSTLTGNQAVFGGAIEHVSGMLRLTNSTLADNYGGFNGGAIELHAGATITNSTLAANLAGRGGGISGGPVTLQNTILALNTHTLTDSPDCFGTIISLGNNLIGNLSGCTVNVQVTDLTGNPTLDPRLGPFTDTGKPGEGYFPLLSTSPAINTGNDAACLKTDQLGEKRVGPCDIGAIEFQEKIVSSR
jgi:hypothetical protein